MKTIISSVEDDDDITIDFNKSPDIRRALALLGENWGNGTAEDFAVSFISPISSLYGNLLTAWPKEVAPEESLILLSRDIETHLRQYAQDNKVEYFGLSIAKDGTTPSPIPYSWLYDLRQGAKILFMPDHKPSSEHGLWLGFAPLEAAEIEKYKKLERDQKQEAVSDQALDRLDLWQRQFVHMLNTAMADMAQNGFTAMSGMFRTISSLLRQGQSLAKAISQGRGQTIERRLEGGEIKTETDNMRQAILSQLADTTLPETIRAALRQQLKSLNEATKDQTAPLNVVRAAAKSGLVTKGDNIVSLAAFAAAFKALSVDKRPLESRLVSTPAALALRGSVTAINTNAETVREILILLSAKDQPKDVRELIATLAESGQPLTVGKIIFALAEKGHAIAISDIMTALADKGQMAGFQMVAAALAETGQQPIINAVVIELAESNQQLAAQALAALTENHPQIVAQVLTSLVDTQPKTTAQAIINALAETNQQAATQIIAALAETGQPAVLKTVIITLAENNQQAATQAIASITGSNQQIAAQAISKLVETQPLVTIQNVINALADNNQKAAVQVIPTLANTAQPTVVNAAVVALANNNPQLATQVIATLTEINPQAAAQTIKGLIETQPQNIVQTVITALGNTNQPASINAVVTALTKSDPQTAVQAIAALAQSGQTDLLNKVVVGLTDNNQQTVAQAVASLIANNNPQTVAQAITAFADSQVPKNWQTTVVEKIQDIGAVVGNITTHITETFRDAANYVTAFAAQANTTAPESKFETSTPNPVVVEEFRATSKGICPFCKDNVISNMVGNVFGERTKNVYDSTIGAAGKTVTTFIGSIMKRPTSKGMFNGMKANLTPDN